MRAPLPAPLLLCFLLLQAPVFAQQAPTTVPAPPSQEAPAAPAHPEHGAPAGGITLDSLAEGAVLLEGLGTHHRAVKTRSPEAQAFFDQGLRLTYAFNHDEAARSFARAAQLDPSCTMCFWGVALVLGPNYNAPMLPDRARAAWQAVQKAKALAPQAPPVERALVEALTRRYPGPEVLPPPRMQPYNQAYADAMGRVARSFPADLDVQTLWAEARMNLRPWKLWSLDGKPAPGTEDIVSTLESVLARAPEHPGANHYYIHAVEPSPHPEKALPSATRLGSLMPGAGHVVHMPAHIFQRVGRYADASESNRRAIEADLSYMRKVKPWGYYPMYLAHNYGFLSFSSSMEGRSEESLRAARDSARHMPAQMVEHMPGMDYFTGLPLFALVRFGRWEELLAEPRPDPRFQVQTGLWLHAHGLALARTGRLPEARADLAALEQLISQVPADLAASNNLARDVLGVGARVLRATIAEEAGRPEALGLWQQAVEAADRIAYAEPADWFYPVRHFQGAALLDAGQPRAAEAVFREDLRLNPHNGWSLFGLAQALRAQGRQAEADDVHTRFEQAWARADFPLTRSAP